MNGICKEIYFDNAATTKIRDDVLAIMADAEKNLFYNSSALYSGSLRVKRELDRSCDIIRNRLSRHGNGDLIITSGATEANNLVIFGKVNATRHHMVVFAGEHSSVYAPSIATKMAGITVDYIPLESDGCANLDVLAKILKPTTTLVVFGMVNSDIGAIQLANEIVETVRAIAPKAHIHCDAVQAFCKLDFDVDALDIDSCSISAHKIYGPKGVGALWLRKGTNLKPILYGGSQQDYRPGTENNAGIIGFARAVQLFDTEKEYQHILDLRNILVSGLPNDCRVTNDTINPKYQSPYIVNITLPCIFGNTMMNALSKKGIFVGLGSACSAKASKNRTLIAMGIGEEESKYVLRVSFGHYNTVDDVENFLYELKKSLDELR